MAIDPQARKSTLSKSERIGHGLVALPIAHVLGSALYLWSYCTGFGAGLIVHASLADLVSVSITDMVFAYLVALGFPVLGVLARYSTGKPYLHSGIEDISGDTPQAKSARAMRKSVWIGTWFLVTAALAALIGDYINRGYINFPLIQLALTISSAVALIKICEQLGASNLTYEVLSVLMVFVISIVLMGLGEGQRDRRSTYTASVKNHTSCGNFLILRRFGDRYLASTTTDRKFIISSECKVVFRIPAVIN